MKSSFRLSSASKQKGLIPVIKRLAGLWGTRKESGGQSQGHGRRRLVLETLENRELLSVSVAEFDQIRTIYSDFGLSDSMSAYNVVDIEVGDVAALRAAVSQSHITSSNDLIVVRSDAEDLTNNVLDLGANPLSMNLAEGAGSVTIVGLGDTLPQITGTSHSLVSIMSGDVQLGGLSLTGKAADNDQTVSDLIWEGSMANLSTTRMLYGALDANGLHSVDFMISETEGAFLTGVSDAELETYSQAISDASSERYYVGVFYDAEKTGIGDSELCWAGTTSNVLFYTGWAHEDLGFTNEDDVFDYFRSHFSDYGGNTQYGVDWFLTGNYTPLGWENWAQPTAEGGAFYPNVDTEDVLIAVGEGPTMVSSVATGLKDHCGVGVSIGWYNGVFDEYDRRGGHAVTAWGYIYDTSLETTNPSYYTSLLLSDSDDDYGGGRLAPNILTAKPIIWDSTANTYELDYDLNSSTHTGWLNGFTILEAYDRPVAPGIFVNTTDDIVDPNDEFISLREAVAQAEKLATPEKTVAIGFDDSVLGQTITLTSEITISKGIIISGKLEDGTAGITISGNNATRIFNISTSENVTLEGLKFESANSGSKDGGAVYAAATDTDVALKIISCEFSGNLANGSGGAIYAKGYTVSVRDSNFRFNSSQANGGALCILGPMADVSEIKGSTFDQNWSSRSGGAVYAESGISVSDSEFVNNTAQSKDGGALFLSSDMSKTTTGSFVTSIFLNNVSGNDGGAVYSEIVASFDLCWFSANQAFHDGGAVYLAGPAKELNSMGNSCILANSAAGSGGGIYTAAATNYTRTRVEDNTAGAQGGGIYAKADTTMVSSYVRQNSALGDGAGIALAGTGTYMFKNSEISRNETGANGGALATSPGQTGTIVNCTIVANSALAGGGLNLLGGANVYNSVVVENVGGDIIAGPVGVVGKYSLSTFTDWTENESCRDYKGMTRTSVFENFETGNYRPAMLSPMIDAGNNTLFSDNGPTEELDLSGKNRYNSYGMIDIGAYECFYSSTVLPVPTSLAVEYDPESNENDVVLTWNTSTSTTLVLVQWSTSSDFQNVQEVYVENTRTLSIPGLLSKTTYYFRVKAIGVGFYYDSAWSSSTSVTIEGEVKLTAPRVFTGQKDTGSTALISWNPNHAASGYLLEYSVSPRFTAGTTVSMSFESAGTQVVSGLSANTAYFFRIKSLGNGLDVFDSEWSSSIYVVTLGELATPTLTEAEVLGCTSIGFVLDRQEDAVSYVVQYCVGTEGGSFDEESAVEWKEYSNAFIVDGLEPDTKYLFRFKAEAKQGLTDSDWTTVTDYTTSNTLATPIISSIKSDTIDSVTLSWSSVEKASQYIVEYQDGSGNWLKVPAFGSDVLSTTVTKLNSNTVYSFRVKAINGKQADSDYSVVQSVRTQIDTDVILDNYYIVPTEGSTLIGTFKKNDCHVFQLAPVSETNDNDQFMIVKVPETGDNPDTDVYQLWTSDELLKGDYVVEVLGAASTGTLVNAKVQSLTISAYQPEVVANTDVIYTSENGTFSVSGFRKDMRDPDMTYRWVNASGTLIKEGQSVNISVSTDLSAIPDETDMAGDNYKTICLRGIDANGIVSEDYPIKVYTSKGVTHSGSLADMSYLDDGHLCKINLGIKGASAATWFVNWGDNTSSEIKVSSRDMTLVHYYQRPNTYNIYYTIRSLAGTEYVNEAPIQFVVAAESTPVAPSAAAEGQVSVGTDAAGQNSVIEGVVIAAAVPEVELAVSNEPVVVDTGSIFSRVSFEPKAEVSQAVQGSRSTEFVLGNYLNQNDSTLRDSDLDKLAIDFIQQKYKRSTGLPGLISTDQFFATLEDNNLV